MTEIIGWPDPVRKATKSAPEPEINVQPTMLDRFVTKNNVGVTTESVEDGQEPTTGSDVFMNEDGTMGISHTGSL